jgi:hypothetical protein
MAVLAVGTATAHTGSSNAITVIPTGPLTISASGTWVWGGMASASTMSYVGFAIDWGDTAAGNDIGTYHVGDGTPATNWIMQPTTPAQGSSGAWGAVSHAYAKPGTYTACVIIYDLGLSKPFATTGYHSLQAGGVNHNVDNSVDKGLATPAKCATFNVAAPPTTAPTTPPTTPPTDPPSAGPSAAPTVAPTATAFESFLGATSNPTATPPVTATASVPSGPDQGLPLMLFALLIGSLSTSGFVLKVAKARQ